MVPFADYWNPDWVKLARLEIIAQAEALTRLNGLRSGELDLALLDGQTFEDAQGAGLATEQFFTTTNQHLQFNRTRAEFGNTLVRQAMSLRHRPPGDRRRGLQRLRPRRRRSSTHPTSSRATSRGSTTTTRTTRSKARELLAEAGLENGFSFDLLVPSLTTSQAIAQIVQAQFAEVGITVNFIPVDASADGGDVLQRQDRRHGRRDDARPHRPVDARAAVLHGDGQLEPRRPHDPRGQRALRGVARATARRRARRRSSRT